MENIGLIGPVLIGNTIYALDLGCGRGGDSAYLSTLGYKVTAVDKEKYYESSTQCDIRQYEINLAKYSVIICNNVLPFINDKDDVLAIIMTVFSGLKSGGAAFLTFYGPNSGFKDRTDMSFFDYEEILSFIEKFPIKIMDKSTSEGYSKNARDEIIYQHSHRFILQAL